jgi:hypothetical protein
MFYYALALTHCNFKAFCRSGVVVLETTLNATVAVVEVERTSEPPACG